MRRWLRPLSSPRTPVVDNEPKICRLLKRTLVLRVFDVGVANTAATAVKQLASEKVYLVILECD